jgi:pycsar effector protein
MAEPAPTPAERIDFAWHCHSAQESWTAKVDTKASIVLTADLIGIAALVGVVARDYYHGWRDAQVVIAVALACVGIVATIAAIFPMLGPRRPASVTNLVYFGQLRRRMAADVAAQLAGATTREFLDELSRQLVNMARLNWIKHRLLQCGLSFSVAAFLLAAIALVA